MKALSLKQPWAELVVSGKKTIEVRKWNSKFRGEFLVHASKNIDKDAMAVFGFSELPLGCIVGKVELINVKEYRDDFNGVKVHCENCGTLSIPKSKNKLPRFSDDKDKHLANEGWGNYGFVLRNARRLDNKECKGQIGFWEFN